MTWEHCRLMKFSLRSHSHFTKVNVENGHALYLNLKPGISPSQYRHPLIIFIKSVWNIIGANVIPIFQKGECQENSVILIVFLHNNIFEGGEEIIIFYILLLVFLKST